MSPREWMLCHLSHERNINQTHSEAPFHTCGCASMVKKRWQEWMKPKPLHIASGNENGFRVPQNVERLKSDLSIISLGHTKKRENHIASKLVHKVSQVPAQTGNVSQTPVNQSLWTICGVSRLSSTQQNNLKSYLTTIWITERYWISYLKIPHIYIVECSAAMKEWCTEPGRHCWTVRVSYSVNKARHLHECMYFQYP